MQLYLLRHATAEPHGLGSDAARALVEKGHRQVKRAAAFCKANELLPELVLTSPLRRAVETARGFCRDTGIDPPVVVPWLACERAGDEAMRELDAYRDHQSVMLVGHEPDFSMITASLLGTSAARFDVTKASLILMDMVRPSPGRATLLVFLPNRLMP